MLKNRLGFLGTEGDVNPNRLSTRLAPIQKFRWIHFPRNAELPGEFVYRVMPVFMNDRDELSYGESQDVAIELRRETYPDTLNVTFTRGFVSSQAFVDRYVIKTDGIKTLLPAKADDGLDFVPTHPPANAALAWMGFEARSAIIEVLARAISDNQDQVRVVAYDLSESGIVSRLEQLGDRLKIIIDDSKPHGEPDSAETQAIREAIEQVSDRDRLFVYGITDKKVSGINLQKPNGNISPVFAAALTKNLPEPFKSEPTGLVGGVGNRMHHKFVVIDFDQPTARVYLGSYNFSEPADMNNGENLLLIRDRRIAVAYVVEALRIFDHYHFRVAQ